MQVPGSKPNDTVLQCPSAATSVTTTSYESKPLYLLHSFPHRKKRKEYAGRSLGTLLVCLGSCGVVVLLLHDAMLSSGPVTAFFFSRSGNCPRIAHALFPFFLVCPGPGGVVCIGAKTQDNRLVVTFGSRWLRVALGWSWMVCVHCDRHMHPREGEGRASKKKATQRERRKGGKRKES